MKIAIMQPYFFPYIGYFQLMSSVDRFVIYDNIKYTKKGWINRNRYLLNGKDADFSIALHKASDSLNVIERELSPEYDRSKLANRLKEAYRKAPYFSEIFPIIERIIHAPDTNLFDYIHHSVFEMARLLGIQAEIVVSSKVPIDHSLKAQDKVLAVCRHFGAGTYINAIGGQDLYDQATFQANGLKLCFIKTRSFEYRQFDAPFVPWLSIIDVLLFNGLEKTKGLINDFDLI